MKRVISTMLVVALITAFVAGCGGKDTKQPANATTAATQSTAAVSEDTAQKMQATLKLFFPGDPPAAQDSVNAALTEKLKQSNLDFNFEYTFCPWDQYWNKLALIGASGDEYDLTWTHISQLTGLVAKKALAPLDDAIKNYGPEIIKSTPDYSLKEVSIDGKIYGIPRVMPMAEFSNFLQIRGDLRKKYNVPEIKTVDDMEKYLEAIKKNEPNMVPLFNETGRFLLREYGDVFLPVGDNMQQPVYIDPADPELKVKNFFQSDIFKNIMMKMRDWMAKGYMIEDGTKIPDTEAALNAGTISATWSVVLKGTERIDAFKAANPNGDLENVFLHPEKPKYVFNSTDNLLSVLSTSKHVNEAVAFVNWFRSNQENYDLFSLGVKDVNYKLDGDSVSYDGISQENNYVPINWAWNDIRFARFSKQLDPQYVESLKNWDKDAVKTPLTGFVFNADPVKTEMAQLNAVMGEFIPMLYKNKIDWNTTFDKFNQKLKDANIDKVIAEVQKQVDAYTGKK